MKPFETLQGSAEETAEIMITRGLSVMTIPDHNNLALVVDDTPEADSRKKELGTVITEIEKNGKKYLICAH